MSPSLPDRVHFEQGRTWTLDELPPRSIALDGAVRGPAIDNAQLRYSFDHHDQVIRHATLATCEQVREALLVGLDPADYQIFINDIDGDTVLSLWLLLWPERLRGEGSERLFALVDQIGRIDALGPGRGEPHPVHVCLSPETGAIQTRQKLVEMLGVVERWWRTGDLPTPPKPAAVTAFWLGPSGEVVHGEVARMDGLYRIARVGVLYGAAAEGTTAYTIGKASEFVDYDVRAFLAAMNALEPGWGGGSTIGGAPRHSNAARSRLPLETVARVFASLAPPSEPAAGTA